MSSFGNWIRESPVVRVVVGFTVAALVLWGVGWLVTGTYRGWISPFDSSIRGAIRQMQSPMWATLLLTVTKLGSTIYLIIVGCVAGIVLIVLRWFKPLVLLIAVMAGQAALHHGFKWLVARPRPSALINYKDVESFSYPSGHAVAGLCLYATIAWFVSAGVESPASKAGVWIFAALLIFLIGLSRVYIGIHYPSDVLAGFLGAAIWTAAVLSIDRRAL